MTVVRQRIEVNIPRKQKGSTTQYDKSLERFFEQITESLLRHTNFEVVKAVIIASPGFLKVFAIHPIFSTPHSTALLLTLTRTSSFRICLPRPYAKIPGHSLRTNQNFYSSIPHPDTNMLSKKYFYRHRSNRDWRIQNMHVKFKLWNDSMSA